MQTQLLRCGIYARTACGGASEIEVQLAACQAFLDQHVFRAGSGGAHRALEVRRYIDCARSGREIRRPGLDRIRSAAGQDRLDLVIMTSLTRLSRSARALMDILDELRHADVPLFALTERFSTDVEMHEAYFGQGSNE